MAASVIDHYLERHAEPIVAWFQTTGISRLPRTYQFVLVIPVFNEAGRCLEQVLPADLRQTLVIVVVNSAVDSDPLAVAHTAAFLNLFQPGAEPMSWVALSQESDCLVVDCATPGRQLPAKQGVGLARKIGGDLALACIRRQVVRSAWIHCTDADAQLPLNYFDAAPPPPDVAVAIYPFTHQPPHNNIVFYELSLRYYVLQLAQAGSPYAFQTIGSLLKINAYHYAVVRGFPKRQAAEDFYMLNKLAKAGQVWRLKTPAIRLDSRLSNRVPFGTGAAMQRLAQKPSFTLYQPQIFVLLSLWLRLIPALWSDRAALSLSEPLLGAALSSLGLEKVLTPAYQHCRDVNSFCRYLWGWFDAFRTLKFIHYLRDHALPNWPVAQAIAPLTGLPASMPPDLTLSDWQRSNAKLIALEHQLPLQVGPTVMTAPQPPLTGD
ncbi:MAG: hypothetical protein ACTS3T_13650 [Almyronema sp.]